MFASLVFVMAWSPWASYQHRFSIVCALRIGSHDASTKQKREGKLVAGKKSNWHNAIDAESKTFYHAVKMFLQFLIWK